MAEIRRLYAVQPEMCGGRSFEEDVLLHVQRGYVWSSPRAFIMGRLVCSAWPWERVWDVTRADALATPEEADAWFLYLAVGDVREFFRVAPVQKDFVCFFRRGSPRWYRLDAIQRRCTAISSSLLFRSRQGSAVT